MNTFETISMNNPVRGFLQEKIEVSTFRKLSSLPPGKTVLEIGCGNGWGTKLIAKYFKPQKIYAIDLDPKMIQLAKKNHSNPTVTFQVGDASKLPYKTNLFDAVFDFGIIHHIPNWKDCIDELKRVLKPGGELLIEDLSTDTFETPFGKVLKQVLDHPYKFMFRCNEFIKYIERSGFKVKEFRQYHPIGTLKYFVLIAQKK